MKKIVDGELLELLELVRSQLPPDQELYLVGGAVRDLLLGHQLHDLDFAASENPTRLAKQVAAHLRADFFVLDDERHTARVVHRYAGVDPFPLDFVQFTGESLEADLNHRDFTVNAMAIPLSNMDQIIDPLEGRADLAAGKLKVCSETSLIDDPVRVLRGIRLAMEFDFRFAEGLTQLMKQAAQKLPTTSDERQRDEFFRILSGPKPTQGIKFCNEVSIFRSMIPPLESLQSVPATPPHQLGLWEHTITTVDVLNRLLRIVQKHEPDPDLDPIRTIWWLEEAKQYLQAFTDHLNSFFTQEITPGRTKRSLTLLGGLLHDLGKPLTMTIGADERLYYPEHAKVGANLAFEVGKKLRLSNAEAEWVRDLVRCHMRLFPLVNAGEQPSRKTIYRFFNDAGESGVAIALFSLADTAATYGETLSKNKWQQTLTVSEIMLSAWFNQHQILIAPNLYLDGNDLQHALSLEPGPIIGWLLSELREAQASGVVQSQEKALTFIRNKLENSKFRKDLDEG